MREQILESLDTLVGVGKPKEVWAVYYKDNLIVFPSKKSYWATIGAAKNALRYFLPDFGDWRIRLDEIRKLEESGVIKYLKLL